MFYNLKKIMMWLITACSALFITTFCIANRTHVEIDIWPFPFKQQVPLFALLLICLGIGVLWGGLATWLSAGTSRKKNREAKRKAIAAKLDARQAEERYLRLEEDLQGLKAQEKFTQNQIETSHPLKLSSDRNTA